MKKKSAGYRFAEKSCVECGTPFSSRSDRCAKCAAEKRKTWHREWERTHKGGGCPHCGKAITRYAARCQSCAKRQDQFGESNSYWKGGRTRSNGYVSVRVNGKYIREHRYVWEQAHGPIPKGWQVHHLNGIKDDNRLENLAAMSNSDHHRDHHGPWEARIKQLESRVRELETA